MSDLEQVDHLLNQFIENSPTLSNGKEAMGKYVAMIDDNFNLSDYKILLERSYYKFEEWLNDLLVKEKPDEDIVAFNFGLYEIENSIQIYISGSNEWDSDDEDWESNNDYFPEGRYLSIPLYDNLYRILDDNFEVGLFLTIASTIILIHTYVGTSSSRLPKGVALATGFDDGDLYNFGEIK
ncbi:hypothetical protein QUF88_13335 [Bacillus sp. DX1.1]|uniref:hypothetical protein n=1 Tax=unclassified Bacillus (in: firmicutes) TaxID=185979 RepID=UPI00256FA946|nr:MULTISPECIES: hypothetical protein [unclassified Bacillus (in: firmicutes)]MDM5154768.1 hypothetical protein [Bacillus sp. DX1.1]WJE83648.1 hypothetical protein QRE67_10830 [Bacillus sp. DX3.1]